MIATKDFLKAWEQTCADRCEQIRNRPDGLTIKGTTYYVSAAGDDTSDGLTPATAWKSLARVSDAELCAGDGVLFRRGDIFRGVLRTRAGVSYGAYGEGEKPRLYGWDRNLADETLWELQDAAHIKGWSYENTASEFVIRDNVFDRAAYRMLHLVARERESCPVLRDNLYIQTKGMTLGQYGANKTEEPPSLSCDENAETVIKELWGDKGARVYFVE